MAIAWAESDVPYITTEQMIEVDRAMMEDFGIDLVRMMENAGRNLAHLARERFLGGDPRDKRVVVLAGTGGNGGGALVAARRLHGYGAKVEIVVATTEMTPVPAQQLAILREIGVAIAVGEPAAGETAPDLIIDGLIGYSLQGDPRGVTGELIIWANKTDAPILALDTPSGLDTTTGTRFDPAVRAVATMTLALPKEGLRSPAGTAIVGELYLADISVPTELYGRDPLHLDVGPIFATSDVIRLV